MRILFIIKSLALAGGGAERVLARISTELAGRGHEITILSFDAAEAADFYPLGTDVSRERLGVGRTTSRSGFVATVGRLARIRSATVRLCPDVVVAFMHSAFIPACAALVGTGIPIVGSERTAYDHYRKRPLQRLLLRLSVPFLERLTGNAETVRNGYPRAIAEKMTVVPNPVLAAEGRADPVGGKLKTLLCVGGLRPEKGHAVLLASFASISKAFPDWTLRIVGDGPLRQALAARAAALNIRGQVQFAGATVEVEREYRQAQMFVLPSSYEAFPNCLAEALAHGLPVVGFADCPGTNAIILPGVNGELAEGPDRVYALAASLAALMSSPVVRRALGQAAPGTVEGFSLKSVGDRWEELLTKAAGAHVPEPIV
jgi:glycosyltransferase involved in cell wall biosynthesis